MYIYSNMSNFINYNQYLSSRQICNNNVGSQGAQGARGPQGATGPKGVQGSTGATGSIQIRSTTVGCVYPIPGQSYTASDILQSSPANILDPSYLASPGIQIGPGVDLVTKSAGSKGFSTYIYPSIIYYGLRGTLNTGNNGYLWPGTQAVSGGGSGFPDTSTPEAYFRIQQPTLLSGLTASLGTPPSGSNTVTILVRYTPSGGSITSSAFTVTLTNSIPNASFYNSSLRLNTGDKVNVQVSYTTPATQADLTVQLDMF